VAQVQDIVVGNKNFTDVTKPSEIVQLLLNDDQLACLDTSTTDMPHRNTAKGPVDSTCDTEEDSFRDLWNEEGDDFFGHAGTTMPGEVGTGVREDEKAVGFDIAHGPSCKNATPASCRRQKFETRNTKRAGTTIRNHFN
jgi:hypothetical protein